MKKIIKLTVFNIIFAIIAVLCFSKRIFGLSFDAGAGALKFALTLSLTILGVLLFFFINYNILTKEEKVEYKIEKLSSIEECISALEKCKRTDPSFKVEIEKAISQLETLKRRDNSLKTLLEQNNAEESFSYLNNIAQKANSYVFANIKRIINRLIVFDNEEYLQTNSEEDISIHKSYVDEVLKDNDDILKEYQKMLIAVSGIADTSKTNLEEIKNMTAALNHVLKSDKIEALEKKYSSNLGGTI
ncbi:MAG: hypothetical protein ACI4UE_03040 [Candidatus Scatovivens sp.]